MKNMTYNLDLNDKFIKYIDDIYKDMDNNISKYKFKFDNGYEVSVVKFYGTRGYESDRWEVSLLKYDKPIYPELVGYDTLGYMSDKDVNRFLLFVKLGLVNTFFDTIVNELESVF